MTRINLLPWRDELRKKKQEEFIVGMVGMAVLAVSIMFGMQMYLDSLITEQQGKKSIVDAKIAELNLITARIRDIQAQNAILQSKRTAIQELQKSRPEIVHFFDEIAKSVPDGVFLNRLKQDSERVELNGKTQSNARVSEFMRNVETSKWLVDPELNIIQGGNKDKSKTKKLSDFTLYVKQWKNKEDEDM
ncbi:MAG: pilus assembly protein PilN [Methyloprofundus sp.]|nr:pilus assembly protein PilN [Methyloprofundus sp.]